MSTNNPDRALSINHPWAFLIAAGFKPVENRSWHTPFVGTIALHASTAKRWMNEDTEAEITAACPQLNLIFDDKRISADCQLFHFGAFIGTVDIVGCVAMPPDGDFRAACLAAGFGDWYDRAQAAHRIPPDVWASGEHCLLLDNPKQFSRPIPAKGKLQIYRLTEAEQAEVAAALRGPLGMPYIFQHKLNAAKERAAKLAKPKLPAKQPARPAAPAAAS
jgi:hypothetical protein